MIGWSGTLRLKSLLTVIFSTAGRDLDVLVAGHGHSCVMFASMFAMAIDSSRHVLVARKLSIIREVESCHAATLARSGLDQTSGVILLNKPFGVICQFSGDGTRPTLKRFMSTCRTSIRREDSIPTARASSVLTADGALAGANLRPAAASFRKTYWVQVEGGPSAAQLAQPGAEVSRSIRSDAARAGARHGGAARACGRAIRRFARAG